jgi:hypothetical protein
MSEQTPPATKLEEHLAVVGRVIAKFISEGLSPQEIDTSKPEAFLGDSVDPQTFEAVVVWMLDEGIIRAKQHNAPLVGGRRLAGLQLTSKGLSIVQHQLPSGDTIATRVRNDGRTSALWSNIGELVGSIAGSFTKSLSSS